MKKDRAVCKRPRDIPILCIFASRALGYSVVLIGAVNLVDF